MIMSRDLTTVEVAEKEDSTMTKRTPPFHTRGLRSFLILQPDHQRELPRTRAAFASSS